MKNLTKRIFKLGSVFFLMSFIIVSLISRSVCSKYISIFSNNTVSNSSNYNKKIVYLTFDDGPTVNNTTAIVDILNKNNIKATFFVIGMLVDTNPKVVQKMASSDMCIVPHTYSHDYKAIFRNAESYIKDFNRCRNAISKRIGKVAPYMRIPGGIYNSNCTNSTMKSITRALEEKKVSYVEWNVCAGDAEGNNIPPSKIVQNVINETKSMVKKGDPIVILMHDAYYKKTTVEALPQIIKYFKNQGCEFRTFNDITREDYNKLVKSNIINGRRLY